MTPDRITELAKQAGFYLGEHIVSSSPSGFQRFAELVRADALEECALLCDARSERGSPAVAADEAGLIAEDIRSLK